MALLLVVWPTVWSWRDHLGRGGGIEYPQKLVVEYSNGNIITGESSEIYYSASLTP